MGKISGFDASVIARLRAASVLDDDDARKLHAANGLIIIPCSDGDQMPDVFCHHQRLALKGGWPERFHMPSLHGGAMLMAEDCPLYREYNVDELLLQHIREASSPELKGIGTIVLYVHAPCGAAHLSGLTLVHQIVYLMRAKERVKEQSNDQIVVCFIHVHHEDGRKCTYFISRDKWLAFWDEEGRALWLHLFPKDPFPPQASKRKKFGDTQCFG